MNNGYRTCYYRTFVVGRATQAQRDAFSRSREWMDAAIDLVKPGNTTDQLAAVWPKAEEFGFQDEFDAFGLQFGHGVGVGLHERPIISRLNSFDEPIELKEGMLFALETYCPATDGRSAARIEEEVVVTAAGPEDDHALPVRRADGRQRRRPGGRDERDTGVAAGGLDDGGLVRQMSPPPRVVDHGQADAVLDAAARVERLQLADDRRAGALGDAAQLHERRAADQGGDVVCDLHLVRSSAGRCQISYMGPPAPSCRSRSARSLTVVRASTSW